MKKTKKILIRTLKWIGAFVALFFGGLIEAEIYNQFMIANSGSSYQSGWHFVSVFAVIIPISVLSGIIALFGNMKRFISSPLKIWTVSSQSMMFFFWFQYIFNIIIGFV